MKAPLCAVRFTVGVFKLTASSLCRLYPEAPLCAVGFSVGALMLTKYLAEASALRSTAVDLSAARLDERHAEAVAEQQRNDSLKPHPESFRAHGASNPLQSVNGGEPPAADSPLQASPPAADSPLQASPPAAASPLQASPPAAASQSAGDSCNGELPSPGGGRGRNGAATPSSDGLTAAAVVANPFDMAVASKNVSKPWTLGWIYNFVLTFRHAPAYTCCATTENCVRVCFAAILRVACGN